MPIRCFLRLKGIDDFEKRKTVKVSISSADLPDSVLAHEDGCMRVVQQVARKVRNFSENLLRDYRMLLCRYQNVEAWRGKQRLYEVPSLRHIPRSSHHSWVGRHAQKFMLDRPGCLPGIRASSPAFQPATAAGMKR
jgi:hypothetical protein